MLSTIPFRPVVASFGLIAALVFQPTTTHAAPPVAEAITEAVQPFIDDRQVSGAVTLVARDGEIVHFAAQGESDIDAGRKMRRDDLFWIASMTKPVVGVAILMLQDEGLLSVDDPVEKHLPEFANLWLIESKTGDRLTLKRPARKITIKDLLTHTAGLGGISEPRPHSTLAEHVSLISQQPLQFEPGAKWSYSNEGIATLGRIAEVVSGEPFQDFLDDRVFRPLGMRQTTFFPSRRQAKRTAVSYQRTADGELQPTQVYFVRGELWDEERTVKPAGGLYSTAEDMFRFYQMMLNGGEYRGKRILSRAAVKQATSTQTADIVTGFTDGMSWGLGFQVVKEPQGVTGMLSRGTFGHGGAYATQSWADPETGMIYVLMVQRSGFPNGDKSEIREAFQRAAAKHGNANFP